MKLPEIPEFPLPTWMNKGEPLTLAHSSHRYWEKVYSWLTWPLQQIDVDTCAEPLLNLLAYQRNITRFKGEPVSLFRLRVKHAFINASLSVLAWETLKHWNDNCSMTGTLFYCALMTPS